MAKRDCLTFNVIILHMCTDGFTNVLAGNENLLLLKKGNVIYNFIKQLIL
jgi:hypothetical protein